MSNLKITSGTQASDYIKVLRSGAEIALPIVEIGAPVSSTISSSGSASTVDLSLGNCLFITLNGNITLSLVNAKVGVYILQLKQDATGSRTVTWPSNVKWPAATAPTLTTTSGAWDFVTLVYDGTYFSGTSTLNFVV
jgi:hypothetical protein